MSHFKHFHLFLLLVSLVVITPGCLSSKKVNKLVNLYYEEDKPEIIDTGYIRFVYDSTANDKSIVHTQKVKKTFLPLILYYSWNYKFHSDLNKAYLLSSLNKKLNNYADSVGLRSKLNGGMIQLNWDVNPQNFDLTYGGSFIYLFCMAIPLKAYLQIDPASQYINVTYQVLREGQKVEKRKLKIKSPAQVVTAESSTDKPSLVVGNYLSTIEHKMKLFSKDIVDQIMKGL